MISFSEHLSENEYMEEALSYLDEALIQFGGKRKTQFGQVLILAGGAGSGKGFVISNLISLQGKAIDVDALKIAIAKAPKIVQTIKDETGTDITTLDLKTPQHVSKLHTIISDILNLPNRKDQALYASILAADPERKPNLIFDVTLKDIRKLESISYQVQEIGYKPENIHIVWVVNDIEVAKVQNLNRNRSVPEEILVGTHRGAAFTMKDILDMGDRLKAYMDGMIYVAFNKVKVDSEVAKSKRGGQYITMANYIKVKDTGKPQMTSISLPKEVTDKINSYTPKVSKWGK